jgi:LmbE family N-acetylglucosaminyl deacetylase
MSTKILIIAAHPDDEVLGCGATIARHVNAGDAVHVLIMAEGITSRTSAQESSSKELSELVRTAQEANKILGVENLEILGFPDNRMDSCTREEIWKPIEDRIHRYQPAVIYTHHVGDVNIDHQLIHQAVLASCARENRTSVRELYFFEVASSTEWRPALSGPPFLPNHFVEVTGTIQKKLDALKVYASEMRTFPHARSIEALAHLAAWRGAGVGVPAAEAFMTGFKIGL